MFFSVMVKGHGGGLWSFLFMFLFFGVLMLGWLVYLWSILVCGCFVYTFSLKKQVWDLERTTPGTLFRCFHEMIYLASISPLHAGIHFPYHMAPVWTVCRPVGMFKVRNSFVVHSTTCSQACKLLQHIHSERRPTIKGSRSTSIPCNYISTFAMAPHLSAVQWDFFDHFLHMNSIPRAKTISNLPIFVFFMPSLNLNPGIWRFPWWRSWSWRYNLHFCQVGSGSSPPRSPQNVVW